ncbi:tetratricopeptide repeat protein [Mesorhizobium sp. VK4C]|uniref:tetratricopeptide repeat protein n=1 Tax=Mesorhizobium captivum TaxID=3072319 RepID=UPI002A24C37D|nr:tetratricopeptide repeat protein [Mesorhizobium sp. VK4C]MDX8501916.1 tetratricopeptide repeat protein [Mesorhizobium sp. VK4C]
MATQSVDHAKSALGLASDAKWIAGPKPDSAGWDDAIAIVAQKARALSDGMGSSDSAPINWYPAMKPRSQLFVGRHALIWKMAANLHRRDLAGTGGAAAPEVVQLVGFPGVGKSLLAIEYAHRFSLAYPGGIFWLDARADWQASVGNILDLVRTSAQREHASGEGEELKAALDQRASYLWILDGVSPELSTESLHERLAPTANGRTLITTTSAKWSTVGPTIKVDDLDRTAALALLTRYDPALMAQGDAHNLVDQLGRHPLALDMLASLVRDTKVANPLGYWLSKLRNDATEVLGLAEKLELELPTKTAASLACMMQTSIEALPPPARHLLATAIAAAVSLPWSTCASLMAADTDPSDLIIAINRLKSLSLIEDDGDNVHVHPIVRRAGNSLLGTREIERASQALIRYLRLVYTRDDADEKVIGQLNLVVLAMTESIDDNERMEIARAWINWNVRKAERALDLLGSRLEWAPRVVPPVKESDDPWMLAWSIRRSNSQFFDQMPIVKMAERIVSAPLDVFDAQCVRWAVDLAAKMLERDQNTVALILSYMAMRNMEKGHREVTSLAYVINQRACYRLGDFTNADPMMLANIAAGALGEHEAHATGAVHDAACGAYLLGQTGVALFLAERARVWGVDNRGGHSIECLTAVYLIALILRKEGNFQEARQALVELLAAWQFHSDFSFLGRILTLRLLADVSRSLGEEAKALEYFREMIAELHKGPLGSLVAQNSIEAQAAALREIGQHQYARDLLGLLRNDFDGAPEIFKLADLKVQVGLYETYIDQGDGEAFALKLQLEETIRAAMSDRNPMPRFILANTLGLLAIADSTHARLIDLVASALPWQSAVDLLEDINWEFQHSTDPQKRTGYAKRSAARLRRSVALREANSSGTNTQICLLRTLLAQVLAMFDKGASLTELLNIEETLVQTRISSGDQQRIRAEIGALRSHLIG